MDGQAFAGDRDLTPNPADIDWEPLSDNPGYPDGACGITIDAQATRDRIKVVTDDGEVWEIRCDIRGGGQDCAPDPMNPDVGIWNQLESVPVTTP